MISAVVLTKNEAKNIKKCLECLSFCDEIIVVDDFSKDSTRKIARKMGAKVLKRRMNKDYSEQCNYGLNKAKGEWIFFVDADEMVTKKLKDEIISEIEKSDNNVVGYKLKRIDYMWGKWLTHGEIGSFRSLRLFNKNAGGKWVRRVHPFFKVDGKVKVLKNPLLHYPHPTLRSFIKAINRWSTWHTIANKEEGKRASLSKILFYPLAHFLKNFLLNFGFLDGMQGFVFAVTMSFHSFLSWSKLFLLQEKEKS